jgi:RNA-binding protein
MLSTSEKRQLRQRAHALKPVVMVGQHGLSATVMIEIERALFDHELIKIRLRGISRDERKEEMSRICADLSAELVMNIGAVAVLYRANPEHANRRPE